MSTQPVWKKLPWIKPAVRDIPVSQALIEAILAQAARHRR